jgi:drug/metabolite transporter (DMT)-like permease
MSPLSEISAFNLDRKHVTGLILMFVAGASVSMITTCARFAYDGGASTMTLVWMRVVGVLVLVGLLQLMRGQSLALPLPIIRKSIGMAAAMMLMSVGYLSSVAYISVSLAVILLYTFPLMVGVAAPIFGKDRMSLIKAIFLAGTFAGLVIASAPSFSGDADWRGVAWALLAAVGVAWSVTFGASTIGRADPLTVNLWSNCWMFPAASVLALLGGGLVFPVGLAGWIGALAVVGFYVLGFSCVFAAMPKLPPAQVALILNLEPIISTFSAAFVLGEPVAPQTWFGIVVMFGFLTPATIWAARKQ